MKYNKKNLKDVNVKQKKVIVRLDLNVPLKDGLITDTTRIEASLKTLKYLIKNKAKIIVLSHLSRIKSLDDIKNNKKSLKVVADKLQEFLPKTKVFFEPLNTNSKLKKIIENDIYFPYGSIMLLENTRYNDIDKNGKLVKKESKNNEKLAKFWASLGDIYVNDAFGTSHREHASNVGISQNIKESCIGFLIENELKHLSKLIDSPKKPFISVLGGAKVEDKVKIIEKIAKLSDYVIIGGAMAYPFLELQGYDTGKKLFDYDATIVKKLLNKYNEKLVFPVDFITTDSIDKPKKLEYHMLSDKIPKNLFGADIGPKSIKKFQKILTSAKTIFWNGPLGVFEMDQFSKGTKQICKIIAKQTKNKSYTVIGGGDSAAAAKKFKYENDFSFISTGGGASISFIEGAVLPGLKNIKNQKK